MPINPNEVQWDDSPAPTPTPAPAPAPAPQTTAGINPGAVKWDNSAAPAAPQGIDHSQVKWDSPATNPVPQAAPSLPPIAGKFSAAATNYLSGKPRAVFDPQSIAAPMEEQKLAKAGTVGQQVEHSDATRERDALASQALGFQLAEIRNFYLDPQFRQLSQSDQDAIISAHIDQWSKEGIPAGKLNPANPAAWGEGSNFKQIMHSYAKDFAANGGRAQTPAIGFIGDQGKPVVATSPKLLGSEALGAMGVSGAQAIPGIFGGNVGGEIGAAAGGATGIPGGAIVGGIGGSLLGAFGAEDALKHYAQSDGAEWLRNGMENLDDAAAMAEQEHPLWSMAGRAGAQALHNTTGLKDLILSKGKDWGGFAPRLAGGAIGGGIEAASEVGRGDNLDPYKIGEAAASGTIFSAPRYMQHGLAPMTYESRSWDNTNSPRPDLMAQVHSAFTEGKSPLEVLQGLGPETLADTPQNRRALRLASADVRAGRDPSDSLSAINFRPNGLSQDAVIGIATDHAQAHGWDPNLQINVHDSYDSESIPAAMKDKVGPGTLGWKDDDGNVHLVASQLGDEDTVKATLFHEGMHAGVVRLYQDGLQDKFVDIYDHANPRLKEAIAKEEETQASDNPDWSKLSKEERKSLVVDEVLAGTAEHGIVRGEFDSVASWIKNFGREHLGEYGKNLSYSDAEIRKIMATGYDKLSADGSGAGPVRFLNYGIRSRGADLDSLDSYGDKLPNAPEYPQGWFKGSADGEPRYEVSDRDSTFYPELIKQGQSQKLDDVFFHPTLYDAYPHLKDVRVEPETNPRNNASWDPRTKTIYINPDSLDTRGSMIHEIQHAIQDHEGWSTGSSPGISYITAPIEHVKRAIADMADKYRQRADMAAHEYNAFKDLYDSDPEAINELRSVYQKIKQLRSEEGTDYRFADASKHQSDALEDQLDDVIKHWQKAAEEGGIDYDSFHRAVYRLVKSDHPVDWHLANLKDDWRHSMDASAKLDHISENGSEPELRNTARHSDDVNQLLYLRAGGEYEARQATTRQNMNDAQRTSDPQFVKTDRQGVSPEDLYSPSSLTWSGPAETRFSRKYSGNFKGDYQGRQERTEDMLKNHFGNFSYGPLKGLMRPIEEYKGLTHEQIFEAAQDLKEQGFNPEIAIAQGAIPDNSAFVVALKDALREKLDTAREVAGRYRQSGGMRHERELMTAVTELGQLMAVFDKTASNLGRMLHSLRLRLASAYDDEGVKKILGNVRFANGTLDEAALDNIAQTLLTSKDPVKIRKTIDRFDPDWKHYAQSLFYNSLLGTKSVQFGNVLGNAVNIIRGGVADVLGYGAGLGAEGINNAGTAVGLKMSPVQRMHFDEVMARSQGILAGLLNQQTYKGTRALYTAAHEFMLHQGEGVQHENKFMSQSIDNLPLSLVLEWGTRGVQATDAYFRTAIEHSAMQGLATREARRLNGGKAPNQQMVADLMASPTKKMLSDVAGEADRLLFQEDPFRAAEKFSQLMRAIPGGWLITPFVRTPSNIGRTAIETFDPTGRVSQRNREALKEGGPEAYRVQGQRLLATALWAGTVYLINQNMIHGGGPAEPNARAQWLMNNQPYTIGNKQSGFIPMKAVSPVGDALAIIADAYEGYKNGMKKPDMDMGDVSLAASSALADAFMTNSFASSVTDGLERGVKPTMQNLAGSLVKSAVSVPLWSEYKKLSDPYVRDTSKSGHFLEGVAAKASLADNPGAEHYFKSIVPRNELPIKRDPLGGPIMAASPTSDDPVGNELGRLVDSTKQAVLPAFSKTIKGKAVPDDLYNTFESVAGPLMREAVSEIMQDPVYHKTLNDDQRAALIRSNKSLKGLHARLTKQLEQMMLDRDPSFESNFIPNDKRTLATIPGPSLGE